ncbi:hypothetical protein [Oleisolibacter albus]|uniref:hypothetical protein n=1 Tax=Oleisolibacter albus TaxID=2171757 RepID=UPI0012D76018|nr:hypothetical protein [Oleisolibacter albus]
MPTPDLITALRNIVERDFASGTHVQSDGRVTHDFLFAVVALSAIGSSYISRYVHMAASGLGTLVPAEYEQFTSSYDIPAAVLRAYAAKEIAWPDPMPTNGAPGVIDLETYRTLAIQRLDAAAENHRLKIITGGSGMAMVYDGKAAEASSIDEADSTLTSSDKYPYLSAEVGTTRRLADGQPAETLGDVAAVVLEKARAFNNRAAAIEGPRLAAKRAVMTAETVHEVDQILNGVAWPDGIA